MKRITAVKYFSNFYASRRPLSKRGHISLPEELGLDQKKLSPRGKSFDGVYYSFIHQMDHQNLPLAILELVQNHWGDISKSLGFDEIVMRQADFYRTVAVPETIAAANSEVFANAWHRDTTGIPNIQIFILLQETSSDMGPLQYVPAEIHTDTRNNFPNLYNTKFRNVNSRLPEGNYLEFTGSRGDYLLLNTSCQLHRATISTSDRNRDMISLVFEPKKLCEEAPNTQLDYSNLTELIQSKVF
jgi:hypothetical protein